MPNPQFLRQEAQEVRAFLALAKTPELVVQLAIWARELEDDAAREEELETRPPTPT